MPGRRAGVAPRGLIDCMIAAVALRCPATLPACDSDLVQVARAAGVETGDARRR
jgi:predicted nucleic acid-binding protein